jgi:hypothetical protein
MGRQSLSTYQLWKYWCLGSDIAFKSRIGRHFNRKKELSVDLVLTIAKWFDFHCATRGRLFSVTSRLTSAGTSHIRPSQIGTD